MDGFGVDLLRVPGLVRLLSHGGTDQIADPENFPECWAFEDPLPSVVAALLPGCGGAFYDVGANTGFYSILAGKVAPSIQIQAFEPVPDIARCCRENLAVNRVDADLSVVALSDREGTAQIYFPSDAHGLVETSASLNESFNLSGNASSAVVDTITFDAFNDQAGHTVGFVKIDVEGFEHMVLRGAHRVVERDRPLIVVEVLSAAELSELNDFIQRHDYTVLSLRPGMVVAEEHEIRFSEDSWNQLLVPRERVEQVVAALGTWKEQMDAAATRPTVTSWTGCESFQDLLLLQLQVERDARLREVDSLAEESRPTDSGDRSAAELQALREEMAQQMARRARRPDVRLRSAIKRLTSRVKADRT